MSSGLIFGAAPVNEMTPLMEPAVAASTVMFEAFGGGVDDHGVLLNVSVTSGFLSRMGCVIWNSMTRRTRGDVQDNFLVGNRDRPKASEGKRVKITDRIEMYKGKPEIRINAASQLEVE